VKKGMYKTWAEYEADVGLVWTNAMVFNEDGSQVYEDAKILKVPHPTHNTQLIPGCIREITQRKETCPRRTFRFCNHPLV